MELIETCFLTSVVIYHKSVTLCGSTEHFTTIYGFRSYCLCKIHCASNSALRESRNSCSNQQNVGLMMWAKWLKYDSIFVNRWSAP